MPPSQLQEKTGLRNFPFKLHNRIIVPYDGSDNSFRAFLAAVNLARIYDASIVLVHACRDEECLPDVFDKVKEYVGNEASDLSDKVEYKFLKYRPPDSSKSSEIIKEIVMGGYDLVVLAARGTSVSDELYIGSIAAAILMNTNTSVYLVR